MMDRLDLIHFQPISPLLFLFISFSTIRSYTTDNKTKTHAPYIYIYTATTKATNRRKCSADAAQRRMERKQNKTKKGESFSTLSYFSHFFHIESPLVKQIELWWWRQSKLFFLNPVVLYSPASPLFLFGNLSFFCYSRKENKYAKR